MSTLLYDSLSKALKSKQSLKSYIPKLQNVLNSKKQIHMVNMNEQQILGQIDQSLSHNFSQQVYRNNIKATKKSTKMLKDASKNAVDEKKKSSGAEQQIQAMDEQPNDQEEYVQDENADYQSEELVEGEEDVGIYGEQLDEDDMESYQNQEQLNQQFDQEFNQQQFHSKQPYQADPIDQQLNYFRQIEQENAVKDPITSKIEKLQQRNIGKKDWVLKGEVKATERPMNSLLEYDLKFKSGVKFHHEITAQYNQQIQDIIKKRVLQQIYDDRVHFIRNQGLRQHYTSLKEVSTQKSKVGLGELYQTQFKNYLGLGQDKNESIKKSILDGFKQVNYLLDSLSNFHFIEQDKITAPAQITEEKKPISSIIHNEGVAQVQLNKHKVQSEKQNGSGRGKNKRIQRTKKIKRQRVLVNRKIAYGGMTKFEHETNKKMIKNNSQTKVKYSTSSTFFKSMNDSKQGKSRKPNPNIGKAKI